jgi:flagellar biosynthesis/type III secretory pathway chaperone
MTSNKALHSVSQIFELLKLEKSALIDGNVQTLQQVTEQKQAWVDALPTAPLELELDQIREIKTLSDENAALSASCQLAQKSVLQRLAEIRKIQKTMGIYAIDGTFADTSDPQPNVESRS